MLGRTIAPNHRFRIVTKTPAFKSPGAGPEMARSLKSEFERSCRDLRTDRVHALLIHNADDLISDDGAYLFEAMQELQQAGRVELIGVSVYDAAQIERVCARFPVGIVQTPVSVFDQRLIASGHLEALRAARIVVHARSVFLKGLLFVAPGRLPKHFDRAKPALTAFRAGCAAAGVSPSDAALAFVLHRPEIDTVLCGVTAEAQLRELVDAARRAGRSALPDPGRFAIAEPDIVNPANWPAFTL